MIYSKVHKKSEAIMRWMTSITRFFHNLTIYSFCRTISTPFHLHKLNNDSNENIMYVTYVVNIKQTHS